MPRKQVGDIKKDWFCNRCLDPKGDKFTNFGKRSRCFKCHVDKSRCFHSDVQQPPPRSLAHRQAQQQRDSDAVAKRLRDKDAKIAALAAKVKEYEKSTQAGEHKDDELEREDDKKEEYESSVGQLHKHRRFLLDVMGFSAVHAEVAKLDVQIELQMAQQMSALPPNIRVGKADRRIKFAQNKVESLVGKHAKREEELQQLSAKLAEDKVGIDKAREELAEAEQQRQLLYVELQMPTADVKGVDLLHLSGALSDEDVKGMDIGLGKEELTAVLKSLQSALAEKQKAAQVAEAASRAAAPGAPATPGNFHALAIPLAATADDEEDGPDVVMSGDDLPDSWSDLPPKEQKEAVAKIIAEKTKMFAKEFKDKAKGKVKKDLPPKQK